MNGSGQTGSGVRSVSVTTKPSDVHVLTAGPPPPTP